MKSKLYVLWAIIFMVILFLAGCSSLPDNSDRKKSEAITDGESTFLGGLYSEQSTSHVEKSGIFLLSDGLDAFVARALLAEKAERTIDVQYYMFHQDTVGQLLIHSFIRAADRGVRVRILIDDMYGEEADDVWTSLDSHENIEVRLFNPFVRETSKNIQFVTRLRDANYRMHSKSFTVDNQATIVGGRNIGDEYFDADSNLAFADLDLLAIGPVVPEVSSAFDEYWNSTHAYPSSLLANPASSEQLSALKKHLDQFYLQEQTARYKGALSDSALANALRAGSTHFDWADAHVIHDSSEKKEKGDHWQEELLISQLWKHIDTATKELLIISPYFVPGEKGAEALCGLSERGIKVKILTNSLASNDVSAVHAGYSKYRKKLLKAGIILYELDEEVKKEIIKRFTWLPGLSKSSLHAKTMIIDKNAMFVGSMNLDLRSLHINNEIGILFFNDVVAGQSAQKFNTNIDKIAFRVELDGSGSLLWKINRGGKEIIYDDEPYVGFWTKAIVFLIKYLPVDSLL